MKKNLSIIGICMFSILSCTVEEEITREHPAHFSAEEGFFMDPPNVFIEEFQPKIETMKSSQQHEHHMHHSQDNEKDSKEKNE